MGADRDTREEGRERERKERRGKKSEGRRKRTRQAKCRVRRPDGSQHHAKDTAKHGMKRITKLTQRDVKATV